MRSQAGEYCYETEDLGAPFDQAGAPPSAFICPKCDDHMEQSPRKSTVFFCRCCGYHFDLMEDWQTA